MLRHIIYLAVAIASVMPLYSYTTSAPVPSDANIGGHVVDANTGEHIPFCTVSIKGTTTGVLTDGSGHYVFRHLKPGTYMIEASFAGFASQTLKAEAIAGKTLELNFELKPDAFMLDQVVVTSSKSEVKRRESPSLVNVTTGRLLTDVGACSLADGLDFQPGVRVENDCQNCGFTQVRINGLDGHYSQILMNSRPVFSALTGVYGLEQIPANMIDRIEVMRGGGSALFGSSAIGGTINIITKDPIVNSAQASHTLTSIGPSASLDNNTTFNASVVTDNNKAGIMVYGQSRFRDGYDHDKDGFTEVAQLKSQTLGGRTFFKTSEDTKLSVEYHATHEYRRGGDQLDQQPHMAMVAEQAEHNIQAAEATFDIWPFDHKDHASIFAALQNTQRKSYYGSEMDPDAYGRTSDIVVTAGSQWSHPFERLLFMPSQLIGGIEYSYNRLHDITLGYDHDVAQTVNIFSAYAQNEWRDERWGFLIGARVDKHSLINHAIISPRANIRFNPSDHFNFRLSYSTGFRSPQAYDEDFHVAIVGGERVVTILAPNLKEESSQSFSISSDMYATIGDVQTNFLVEGFFTDLKDVFALRQLELPDAAGNTVLERYNGSGATVAGLNLEMKAYFSDHFDMQAGITLQKSRYKKPEYWSDNPDVAPEKHLFRTPDIYGYLTARVGITKRLNAMLTGNLTGPMTVQHLAGSGTPVDVAVKTPTFFDASLRFSYCFKIFNGCDLDITAGVTNIFNSYQNDFDQGFNRDSGYIYGPALPRCITAGVSVSL